MEDEITYTSKANRNSTQPKPFSISKKESKPAAGSIPSAFLRKVHFMEKYPQSLRDYIKKCFSQCTDAKSKDIVSAKLIDKINSVSINQYNWNAQPLVAPVEKEPSPPPPPPPPPPQHTESSNQFQNKPLQAFSSTFMAQPQQQPQMMQQQQTYNYPPPPYGNYQYGQPPNPLMPPPPLQPMMQPNFQNNNNFNQPFQMKNPQYYQNQGRVSGQNSYQTFDYKPQTEQYMNNNEYQYANNQFQPNNTPFNQANPNLYEYNQQNRQDISSFAPGQMFPKVPQNQKPAPPPLTSQLISQQGSNQNFNNQMSQQNNFTINNQNNPNFPGKGKKKKKNKKNKFNQQQQQNQFLINEANNDDEYNSSLAQTLTSRQKISSLQDEIDQEATIVGTSTNLEKEYLRIAGDQDIDPSKVRPLAILKESLHYCLDKYNQNQNYEYISEQLRSIRQDLSVQHIEDPFTVEVYETHTKLAILNKDWSNANQSMVQLEIYYAKKLGIFQNICEFWKYRIIYLFGVEDIDGLCSFVPKIDNNVLQSRDVQFAIYLWEISQSGEWMKYFSIMKKADPYVASVMSLKAQNLRVTALSCICRGFRYLTLEDYRTFLCYDENEDDLLRQFLSEYEIEIPNTDK